MDPHRWRSLSTKLLLLALPLLAAACAGIGRGGGAPDTTVVIENNLIPSGAASIFAVPAAGTRQLLGTVSPGATETFRFFASGAPGEYRFVAEVAGRGTVASNSVVIPRGATIRWSLNSSMPTVSASP